MSDTLEQTQFSLNNRLMKTANSGEISAAALLTREFAKQYPKDAAREFEIMSAEDAVETLQSLPNKIRQRVWSHIVAPVAERLLLQCSDTMATELIRALDAGPCAALISRFGEVQRKHYLGLLSKDEADELQELLNYPISSAGAMMDTRVLALNYATSCADALAEIKRQPTFMRSHIYIVDDEFKLCGVVSLEYLISADQTQTLQAMSAPIKYSISALDPKEDVADMLQKNTIISLPVVDIQQRLLGVIRGVNAIETMTENISADMQVMVGASRDEQALSSSLFAVKKRQPWLQINLLTGFLAAAVVGLFEGTIAQFTALAVLMPVAAGQSGNTGAQALAVTMRGLTLREITIRHWFKVMIKEAGAGFINGVAIAITCGAGVYIWSQNAGLGIVLALAMIISMTIAGTAGALVPICLKKFGLDPAQSSSIILTTITDIAGFMSFLGIATLMASSLA